MAEAAVVEQPPLRFFCHRCINEIPNVTAEYTCPSCATGFIEELPPLPPQEEQYFDDANDTNFTNRLSREISDLIRSITENRQPSDDPNNVAGDGSGATIDLSDQPIRRNRRLYTMNNTNIDNVFNQFLISVSGNSGDATPMFFMGNPADYAWGRGGLDTIVTQLLNQMETTGPPPLSKEKISAIPKVSVTEEHINVNQKCSVCWEDFQLTEIVRQLPCVHIYHENCIIPWLELHGTCPVCRKTLSTDSDEMRLGNIDGFTNLLQGVDNDLYGASSSNNNDPSNRMQTRSSTRNRRRNDRSNNSRTRSNSSSHNSNNEHPFGDGNVDYEFD